MSTASEERTRMGHFFQRMCWFALPCVLASACHDLERGRRIGASCASEGDCREPYVCELGACRAECDVDRDCEGGACLVIDEHTRVCALEGERACEPGSTDECPTGFACGVDGSCRNRCDDDQSCPGGRRCIEGTCFDRPSGAGGSASQGGVAGHDGEGDPGGAGGQDGVGGGGGVIATGAGGEAGAPDESGGAAGAPGSADSPSCAGLADSCGPDQNASCCSAGSVTGGIFLKDNGVYGNFYATVADFRLDTYEITVGRFRKFLASYPGNWPASGSGRNPNDPADTGWDSSWDRELPLTRPALRSYVNCRIDVQTWTDEVGANENLPMTCISWYEAFAFCVWDGGRLPSEAEWNYAAAGGDEQRRYPWSDPPTSEIIDATYAVYGGVGSAAYVGSRSPKGDGRWGQADLAGNVWEWVLDWNWQRSDERAMRGGSFNETHEGQVTHARFGYPPSIHYQLLGARCARGLQP